FFQAEDGIREYKVTGVQTCALPILCSGCANSGGSKVAPSLSSIAGRREAAIAPLRSRPSSSGSRSISLSRRQPYPPLRQSRLHQIGRASCRERVYGSVVA